MGKPMQLVIIGLRSEVHMTEYYIVFIHFFSASLSMSHSEALLPTALILCRC